MSDEPRDHLPRAPIDRLTQPLARYMHIEASSGLVLLGCTLLALALANSPLGPELHDFWETELALRLGGHELVHSLRHWVNDALMTVFFFVVGLEVKREIVHGELRDPRRAALPIAAALGGMLAPALIYLLWIGDRPGREGWGVPMATDIAFVVGCMALLGGRIPNSLRVLLLTLAIADDIGAILVIAVGYTQDLKSAFLGAGALGIAAVALLARLGVRSFGVYTLVGAGIWLCFHASGVHATIAGVILGLQTPARSHLERSALGRFLTDLDEAPAQVGRVTRVMRAARESVSPLEFLIHALHPWVAFAIMPVFALANAGVAFEVASLTEPVAVGVALGLLAGKPLGILLVSWLAVRLGLTSLPERVSWSVLGAAGLLAGIGFTMAIFIAGLALPGDALETAKVGVLVGSGLSAALGMGLLWRLLPAAPVVQDPRPDRNQS